MVTPAQSFWHPLAECGGGVYQQVSTDPRLTGYAQSFSNMLREQHGHSSDGERRPGALCLE